MIIDFLVKYIGSAPEGYEFLQYIVASQFLIFVFWSILKFLAGLINLFKVGS